ncbi:TonB-dependent receptor [Anthocerotibacter panamensis]|uniref:TonB-dependent receptor n=1 Tax=Anthocerotibacter panamensis TaxID=2857077 RepID=UPI001C404FF5|nr:TonB-dependent receptor [Anthocerotibacter panamensis]
MGFLLAVSTFLSGLPAMAQTVSNAQDLQDETKAELLPEVTITATRSPERVFDIPTATTVITNSQAKERTQTSFADLFKGETGVFVRATNPSAGSPVVRGVTGRDVLLLVDGFRLSHAFARPNTQYEGLVDPYFFDRVEIVRGPSSVLYGSDALGGISNILTATYKEGDPTFQAHTDYTSNPSSISSHVRLGFGSKSFATTLGLTYRSFGDINLGPDADPRVFFPNPTGRVFNSGYEYYAGNFKSQIELAPRQTFTLTAQYSRIPTVSRQDSIIEGFGSNVPAAERGFAPQSRTFVLGAYQAGFENSWLDALSLKVGYQQVEDNRFQRNFSVRPSFPNFGTGLASANTSLEGNVSNLFGTVLELKSTASGQRFTYGIEAYFDRVNSSRLVRNDQTGTTVDPNGPRYVDGSTLNQYGIFIQDEIDWSDRFHTNLGLRYSVADLNIPFSTVRPLSSGFSRNFQALNGSLGALYRIQPDLNFVLNVGTGFRAPNVNDLGEAGARRASDINIPNNNLGPERVFSVDGGLKTLGSNFSGELIGFWSQYTDRIDSVALGSVTGSVSQVFQTQNVDSQTIWGIEFGGRYRFSPEWSLYATGTFVYGEFPIAGETTIPPFNGVLGVRYEPAPGVYIEPFVRYAAAQPRLSANDLSDPRINPQGTSGFVLANLRAGLPLTPTTTLRLNVDNIFNATYREHGTTLDGPGTSVSLGADYAF